jgi:ribosomal protein S18 acetylase RimI-like enzyme
MHLSRDCYFLKNKELYIDLVHSDIRIKSAKSENELMYVKKLMEENLDLYTGDQLTIEEIQYFADENLLYIAYERERPCGMLQADFKNGVFWLGHIVVDANYRGKGIAKLLVVHYLNAGIKLNCNQFQLWVIQENLPALNLYKKYGFNYLNRSTCSMLKK